MVLCWAAGFCFGLLRPAHGLPFPDFRFILWPTQGMEGEGTRQTPNTSGGGCHGGCSPEDRRNRAAVNGFPIRGHGEREESEGVPFGDYGHG